MASYGKEDFVTGSDLSDISDFSEDDMNPSVLSEGSSDSEDDGRQYCVCGKPSTTEMIACDDEQCTITWWHYDCAGLCSESIPEFSWVCELCRPGTSASTAIEEPSPSSNPPPSSASVRRKPEAKTTKKAEALKTNPSKQATTKKAKKPAVKRPPAKFTGEDAAKSATGYVKTSLAQIKTHPILQASYPIAICMMGLWIQLVNFYDTEEFKDFCTTTVSSLWLVVIAGDSKSLKPESSDLMWRSFINFRISSQATWRKFLTSLNLYDDGQHTLMFYQYLLQSLLHLLIQERNKADMPEEAEEEIKPITEDEEQVLRYVAGYIPYSLHKRYKKLTNATAVIYCKFLKTWQVCTTDTTTTFLEYTNHWLEVQNRGGLFHVSDTVFLFFRTMENETRMYLTTSNLDKFPGVDIQSALVEKICSHTRLQYYWCTLTKGKLTGDNSTKLLGMIVKKWIKIRSKSFINVYLNLKKASGGNVSKKAEKALRKDLNVSPKQ